jgi:hypothetical protein
MNPPIEHNLDESAYIEQTATGFALVTPLVRVNLDRVLSERLAINVYSAQHRAASA